jgi:hypothetical protein
MTPPEALAYLTQICNDYARTLPPSAAGPFQFAAQDAVNTLEPLTRPPAEVVTPERTPLRAVSPDAE